MTIGASGGLGFFPILILGFLAVYVFFLRPQRQRQNRQRQILDELSVGDEVLTVGGIYGTISSLGEDEVTVEIAPNLEVRVARRAIASVSREPEPDESEETDDSEEADEPEDSVESEESEQAEEADESEATASSPQPETDSTGAIPGSEPSDEENRG